LIAHTQQICGPNPYDTSLQFCDGTTRRPFTAVGWAVLAGGLVQAYVLLVIGWLCGEVERLRGGPAADPIVASASAAARPWGT
jgi:hypothetical protein